MDGRIFSERVRKLGVRVITYEGWLNEGRPGNFGDMHGVMHHHTVTRGISRTVDICRDGYSGLPGALCHGVIAKNGDLHLIAWGRANHAGKGDAAVHAAVIREDAQLPAPRSNTVDGNSHFYGFESENLGDNKDPWPDAQLDTMAIVSYVICASHAWSERSVIGHKEWQKGKVDPRGPGVSMGGIRKATGALLRGATPPKPAPPLTVEQRLRALESRVTRLEG